LIFGLAHGSGGGVGGGGGGGNLESTIQIKVKNDID